MFFKISLCLTLLFSLSLAQNAAPSVYFYANDQKDGDIITRTIRGTITTPATYFCAMQWNAGSEGGAYTGIQDSPDQRGNRIHLFSIWDPSNKQPIKAIYKGPGTQTESFGGEGTGLKSWNFQLGWTVNQWYTTVIRRWDSNGHTLFGWWTRDITRGVWTHMVTMDYPVANVYFNSGGTNAFLEDWSGTGSNVRRFDLKEGYKRDKNGNWISMSRLTFSVNEGDLRPGQRSSNYATAYNSGQEGDTVYMQTGGNTQKTCKNPCVFSTFAGSGPSNPTISFNLIAFNTKSVGWVLSSGTTPQFKYTVKVDKVVQGSSIDPEARMANINGKIGSVVEITLEDIYGRSSVKTTTLIK